MSHTENAPARSVKKRRPIIAAVLSLIAAGLGQLYNGQLRRALVFAALEITFFIAIFVIWPTLPTFAGFVFAGLSVMAGIGNKLFAALDAFVGARKVMALELRRYNRWIVYLPVGLLLAFPNAIFQFDIPFKSYYIASGVILPVLAPNDYVMSDNSTYLDKEPKRGELVVFKSPSDNKTDYIRRLIGLPGERIQIRDGVLHINGTMVLRKHFAKQSVDTKPVEAYLETLPNGREYVIWMNSDGETLDNTKEYLVPPGHYFFLGDNRTSSEDNRIPGIGGFVPRANLVGRLLYIYWSKDRSRIGTKLN